MTFEEASDISNSNRHIWNLSV